jgi:hypothetical protein
MGYGQIRLSIGVMGLNAKAPVLAGAFLIVISSIAGGVELIGSVDMVCFYGVRWFGGLTGFWGGSLWILWRGLAVGRAV